MRRPIRPGDGGMPDLHGWMRKDMVRATGVRETAMPDLPVDADGRASRRGVVSAIIAEERKGGGRTTPTCADLF